MQAVIMAAGKGMRMRPLTNDVPKALLQIGNQTILDHTLSQLPGVIDEIIIVVGYLQDKIRAHVAEKYPDKNIVFIEDPEMKGTGYCVTVCRNILHGDFLVLNGDDLYDKADLERLVKERWSFLVREFPDSDRFGVIQTDGDGNFTDIVPSVKGQPGLLNIGAYVVGQEYFDFPLVKSTSGEFSLPHTLLEMAKQGKQIKTMPANYWEPIGFPEDLEKLREKFA